MTDHKLSDWQKKEKIFSFGEPCTFNDVAECVGPGWRDTLDELCAKLFALGWNGELGQVKEKFGSLRFYFLNTCRGYEDIAFDVVDRAEHRTESICEKCGKYGKIRGPGWLKCLCDEHAKERAQEGK